MSESLTVLARECAYSVHMGQRDKAGLDYVAAHVQDVVNRVGGDDELAVVVAWLHDVVEDGHPSVLPQLHETFPDEVMEAVVAITHRPNERRMDYYERVKANPLALRVKLADIASNTDPVRMAMLDDRTRSRLTAKYAEALAALGVDAE